ncbi:uncharacterized protein B0T23DRAFT_159788 [Neurospora hispaniola]|uniref:Uncharacterized protein n=1 Tax=Neurospora hispaniola TaxID=588809 RepID=A0AAJ0MQE3_9PEZI|nr:hypothetical protein B0T23DRAFT_159788 [Neurospora hispaniola]
MCWPHHMRLPLSIHGFPSPRPCLLLLILRFTPLLFIQGERDIMSYGPLGQVLSLPDYDAFLPYKQSRFSSLHPPQQAKDLFNYQRRHMNKPTISINALAKTNDTISTRKKSSHKIPESYPPPSLV